MGARAAGKYLQVWRRKANLTQPDLARLMEVSLRTIAAWENGEHHPGAQRLDELCRHTGASRLAMSSLYNMDDDDPKTGEDYARAEMDWKALSDDERRDIDSVVYATKDMEEEELRALIRELMSVPNPIEMIRSLRGVLSSARRAVR